MYWITRLGVASTKGRMSKARTSASHAPKNTAKPTIGAR